MEALMAGPLLNALALQTVHLALHEYSREIQRKCVLTTHHWWLINHHGGLRYPCLLPGVRNWAAELLSRGSPPQFGCEPHSLMESGHALSIDALAHRWPKTLLYVFQALPLLTLCLEKIRQYQARVLLVAQHDQVLGTGTAPVWSAMAIAGPS